MFIMKETAEFKWNIDQLIVSYIKINFSSHY